MGQAPLRRCVWDSSSACQWAYLPVGQSGLSTYPLKPSHAVEPGHIPLRKLLKSANRFSAQRVRSSRCWANLLSQYMKRVAFQLFLTRSEHAPLLPSSHQPLFHSSPIPHLFLAQTFLNYPEKAMNGEVLFGLALIKQSLRSRYSRISHWWFWAILKGTSAPCFLFRFPPPLYYYYLSTPMNQRTAWTCSTFMVIHSGERCQSHANAQDHRAQAHISAR